MCGIFGFYARSKTSYSEVSLPLELLFRLSNSRGKEASGVAVMQLSTVSYTKTDSNALGFLKSEEYKNLIESLSDKDILSYIGHARMTTHGTQLLEKNNQPVFSQNKTLYCVHNGIVTNYEKLWQKYLTKQKGFEHLPDLDTQVVADILAQLLEKKTLEESLNQFYRQIEGVANLAIMIPKWQTLVLSSNTGSLYWFEDRQRNIFFASEKIFLTELIHRFFDSKDLKVKRVNPTSAVIVSQNSTTELDLTKQISKKINKREELISSVVYKNFKEKQISEQKKLSSLYKNSIEKLKQHNFDYERIYNIQRCTKCILPATTPFITFNEEGVCNYCLEHEPISFKGSDSLEHILKKYRKNNGEPDCLIAFSGGRDSSYGLHLLKTELGMNPLAYTYDWGMISDLGRRNQARVLGKLGVEQILISADIAQKRKHIKQNILAWIKNPHLGMIPLFMAGDKQCEFYADQTMKKYNIELMIYCRGNELEREEFKAGHCGVKDADPGGVIHNLAFKNKMKMLSFYGTQYLRNPDYFNSSLVDTSFAFFSTYMKPHNFLYLWHYLPWEEKLIGKTLQKEYNWEISSETPTTWRIGDGTPAFYNYIYYQVQGFTENDSLRARQVREGLMSREEALTRVKEENKPQYNNLKWYFDTLELDGDMILSVVDNMKKLY